MKTGTLCPAVDIMVRPHEAFVKRLLTRTSPQKPAFALITSEGALRAQDSSPEGSEFERHVVPDGAAVFGGGDAHVDEAELFVIILSSRPNVVTTHLGAF